MGKWDKRLSYDALYQKRIEEGKTGTAIALELGVPDYAVYEYMYKYSIIKKRTDFNKRKSKPNAPGSAIRSRLLSGSEKQLILGSLLGDGHVSLHKGREANTFWSMYQENHALKQRDYLLWKYEYLKGLCLSEVKPYEFRAFKGVSLCTAMHPYFLCLRKLLYESGKKEVNTWWLNQLDDLAVAAWYGDDGSNGNGTPIIATCGFSVRSNELLMDFLATRYGLSVQQYINSVGNRYITVRASTRRLEWLELMRSYLPSSMHYKTYLHGRSV